uniref:Uncharacterized protein n=1 Tax=Myripristis murdjan TaxID=586833 RepID=A0A667WW30_9TELE
GLGRVVGGGVIRGGEVEACCMLSVDVGCCPLPATHPALGMPDTRTRTQRQQVHKHVHTLPPSQHRACHRECPMLMFIGKPNGCQLRGIGTASGPNSLFCSIRGVAPLVLPGLDM